MSEPTQGGNPSSHGQLGLWDTVSIIIAIVIGSSIFETPPTIFQGVSGPWEGLGLWLFCGLLSFIGALCYAELATTYPRAGGDYVYLTRGFDRPIGFLFGWAQLAVILAASTGAMAFIFGSYGAGLLGVTENKENVVTQLAVGAVVIITALNFFGVVLSKWMLNGLVIIKLLGLALIVIAAIVKPAEGPFEVENATRGGGGFSVSMILILYAFGGWNDAAFVASDLKDRRNIPKALFLGTLGITAIYLLVNFAYILSLGFERTRGAYPNIAAHVLDKAFGETGSTIISLIVMTSALGAMNGLIFTGSRVYLSLGSEHRVFALLGQWNAMLKAPIWSLIAQALVTVGMILTVGTQPGRDAIDQALGAVGIDAIPWGQYFGGFNTLFAGAAPAFWIFFLLTGFSMFALRARDPNIERPFKLHAPWYPILPIIFCAMCLFGFYAAMRYAGWISLLGFVPLFLGLPLYWLSGSGPSSAAQVTADDRFKPAG